MHFFNPVPLMALVEAIAGPLTDAGVVDTIALFGRRLGKTPVVAADMPGFIVNRVARPYYLEAFRILGEGAAGIDAVDAAMRGIGFRMGPFELIDAIGADVNFAVSRSVFDLFFGDPRYRPHPLQRTLIEAGRLGRKTGGGCYDYDADGARGQAWEGLARRAAGPQPVTLDRPRSRLESSPRSSTRRPPPSPTGSRPRTRSIPPCGWGRTGPKGRSHGASASAWHR